MTYCRRLLQLWKEIARDGAVRAFGLRSGGYVGGSRRVSGSRTSVFYQQQESKRSGALPQRVGRVPLSMYLSLTPLRDPRHRVAIIRGSCKLRSERLRAITECRPPREKVTRVFKESDLEFFPGGSWRPVERSSPNSSTASHLGGAGRLQCRQQWFSELIHDAHSALKRSGTFLAKAREEAAAPVRRGLVFQDFNPPLQDYICC